MPTVILTGSEWVWLQNRALPAGTTPGQELHKVLFEAMTAPVESHLSEPGTPQHEYHTINLEYRKAGRGG